ncbi:MAG: hypothetical protein HQL46_08465 [Gammaproteobacteria bacterium]|nr:hypothetical protein [Gammaproteobacteria bacterium]
MVKSRTQLRVSPNKQLGQSMVEYVVVLMTLIGLAAATNLVDAVADLGKAISYKNHGYAYAISLSDYPDAEELKDLSPEAAAQVSKLQDTFDAIDNYQTFDIPAGIDTSGMPDIDFDDIMNAML